MLPFCLVRSAWALFNGCKSRVSPNSRNYIAKGCSSWGEIWRKLAANIWPNEQKFHIRHITVDEIAKQIKVSELFGTVGGVSLSEAKKWSRYKMERQCPYPRRSHGHDDLFLLRNSWSKTCRDKSADTIVPKARVPMGKDRIGQCNSKWLLPCDFVCNQMSERNSLFVR